MYFDVCSLQRLTRVMRVHVSKSVFFFSFHCPLGSFVLSFLLICCVNNITLFFHPIIIICIFHCSSCVDSFAVTHTHTRTSTMCAVYHCHVLSNFPFSSSYFFFFFIHCFWCYHSCCLIFLQKYLLANSAIISFFLHFQFLF